MASGFGRQVTKARREKLHRVDKARTPVGFFGEVVLLETRGPDPIANKYTVKCRGNGTVFWMGL